MGWYLCWSYIFICLFICLFFLWWKKAKWSGNPVCWWLAWYFCFVCCLGEMSYTVYYWWLGDAQTTCIKVVSFVWVLTTWYSLTLVIWLFRIWSQGSLSKGSELDPWSGTKIPQVVCYVNKWDKNKYSKMRNQRWTPDKWQLQNQANNS